MNDIEIVVVKLPEDENCLQTVYNFCEHLNSILSGIRLCHVFTNNYSTHTIYGALYGALSNDFDSLMEEVVGLYKSDKSLVFPENSIVVPVVDCESDCYDSFKLIVNELYSILTLNDFTDFVDNAPKNGINNKLEEIFSEINKADYLLSMATSKPSDEPKILEEPEVSNLDSENQTYIAGGQLPQTFEIPQV